MILEILVYDKNKIRVKVDLKTCWGHDFPLKMIFFWDKSLNDGHNQKIPIYPDLVIKIEI